MDEVYQITFPGLWRLLARLGIPTRHRLVVAQDAYLRVAERLSTYDTTGNLTAWVFKLATQTHTCSR